MQVGKQAVDGGQGSISQDELPSTGKTKAAFGSPSLSSGLLERSDSRRRATSTSSCRFLIVSRHLGNLLHLQLAPRPVYWTASAAT